MDDEKPAINQKMVDIAIDGILGVFADHGLTVAECIKAVTAVDRTLKAKYPAAYDILTE